MPGPRGMEIRQRVIELAGCGWQTHEIADALGVSRSTVKRWNAMQRERGTVEPLPMGGSEPKIDEVGLGVLASMLDQDLGATLDDMRDTLAVCVEQQVGTSSVSRALRRMKITRKKKTYRAMTDQEKNDRIARLTTEYMERLRGVDMADVYFLDEFAADLRMDTVYGRSLEGERAYAPRPTGQGKKRSRSSAH